MINVINMEYIFGHHNVKEKIILQNVIMVIGKKIKKKKMEFIYGLKNQKIIKNLIEQILMHILVNLKMIVIKKEHI